MIANHSEIDVMTTSQIIKLLNKKGLLEKKAHKLDSRANIILLTQFGTDKMNLGIKIVEEIDDIFFGKLKEEKKNFIALLAKLMY